MGAWEKAVASLGPVDGQNAEATSDAGLAAGEDEYTGPCPSPARAWAPWVVVTSGVLAVGNASAAVLNFVERHYQQQRLTGHPPDAAQIRGTLHAIDLLSKVMIIAAIAFIVVGVTWGQKRRTNGRIALGGEAAVEPALRRIVPLPYWGMLTALCASFAVTLSASSLDRAGMTIHDVIDYRTRVAIGSVGRTVMWACWVLVVVAATRYQTRREARVLATNDTRS
jgi:hypothetical protein